MSKSKRKKIELEKFDKKMAVMKSDNKGLTWHDPTQGAFELAGFAWFETDRIYRRLPLSPVAELPEAVDSLANSTAGGQIRFRSDSRRVSVKVKLLAPAGMVHMPATGQCGFDLYMGETEKQTFCTTTKYDLTKSEYEIELFNQGDTKMRNFTLNFPLYQGVDEVLVGLEAEAKIESPLAWAMDKRVVVYGTSITQGGCASRPGMAYTNILSRKLNVEFINLGFSGSGQGEAEVAMSVREVERPALFVLDYEGNCQGEGLLEKTMRRFIELLREKHPTVPILVVSVIPFASIRFSEGARRNRTERMELQKSIVMEKRDAGDENIYFHDGRDLLGSDDQDFEECTVDGVHPTDLGFWRMAQVLEPIMRDIIF